MNVNKAIICGNITRDPEARTLPSGQAVSSFGIATNRVWKDKEGNRQEQVEFHNIVAFGKLAEICNQYLAKGRLVYIEGRLQTNSWETPDGIKKYRTEIIAETMQMGPRREAPEAPTGSRSAIDPGQPKSSPASSKTEDEEIKIEDIPF